MATFNAGDIILAATLEDLVDVWDTYTPTWNGTVGNGTLAGRYKQVGKVVQFICGVTCGSTTAFSASQANFGLPVAANQPGSPNNDYYAGRIKMFDNSATQTWIGHAAVSSSGTVVTCHTNASPVGGVTSTGPFTWATSDRLVIVGHFEVA